jgi:hypothetical protein
LRRCLKDDSVDPIDLDAPFKSSASYRSISQLGSMEVPPSTIPCSRP